MDKPSLELDLLRAEWICAKVRDQDYYAQNIYAALCNNVFQKNEVIDILRGDTWRCSWRHAGGIVAQMQQSGGDYMDWYCSGIGATYDTEGDEKIMMAQGYVNESIITDEVRDDFKKLGWYPVDESTE